jgi:uncharacterized protein (UPF0333 family)
MTSLIGQISLMLSSLMLILLLAIINIGPIASHQMAVRVSYLTNLLLVYMLFQRAILGLG